LSSIRSRRSPHRRTLRALLGCIAATTLSTRAIAFVETPVGGHPGELDVAGRLVLERGKLEPNENQASWQPVRGFREYELSAGYTFRHSGALLFPAARLTLRGFETPAERNDPAKWRVGPGTGAECGAGARDLGDGVCEFHAADRGLILAPSFSFAAVHKPDYALGLFLRVNVPVGVDLGKFVSPKVDYLSLGTQIGVHLTRALDFETSIIVGSGTRPMSKDQNANVALAGLFHLHGDRWLLPWKAGVKLGPFVDGDLTERFDERYDLAYSPNRLAQPGDAGPVRQRDRIRSARFALALLPYFLITDHLAIELGYVQKFFGYDARATQAWFVGVRGLMNVGGS
jgi:hypothetical protein